MWGGDLLRLAPLGNSFGTFSKLFKSLLFFFQLQLSCACVRTRAYCLFPPFVVGIVSPRGVLLGQASIFGKKGGSFVSLSKSGRGDSIQKGRAAVVVSDISFSGGGFRSMSYFGHLLYLEKRNMFVR